MSCLRALLFPLRQLDHPIGPDFEETRLGNDFGESVRLPPRVGDQDYVTPLVETDASRASR